MGLREGSGDGAPLLRHDGDAAGGSVHAHDHEAHRRQSTWLHTSFLVAGEIVGMGIMGLPYATAQLGWAVGLGAAVVFAFLAWYSGVLLGRVKNELSPAARSFAEAARDLVGPRFGAFTEWAIWLNWLFITPYYLMAAANSLSLLYDLCYYQWAAVLLVVLFPFAQLRTLHALRVPALLSMVAVMLVLGVVLLEFGVDGRAPDVVTHTWPPGGDDFLSTYNHLSSFVFAYQGQSMFFEMMREMRSAREFPRALGAANLYMAALYVLTATLAYHYKGVAVASFLPGSVHARWARIVVGLLLTYHVVVAYMLTAQPLVEQVQRRLWPHTVHDRGARGQARWAGLQLVVLAFAYIVANLIPFFADFQNIIGAALGAPIMFGWPVIFYVAGMWRAHRAIPAVDAALCVLFLGVLTPLCTGAGIVAAFRALRDDWSSFGRPFGCHLVGY